MSALAPEHLELALCAQPDITNPTPFYPWILPEQMNKTDTERANREAKAICNVCPVKAPCLEAGKDEVRGTWGGLTFRERGHS